MEPLNANDAQRYAEFKEWTPYEAALLLAGCKPLPRSHIPEPKEILHKSMFCEVGVSLEKHNSLYETSIL